jgi:hypothetical protein
VAAHGGCRDRRIFNQKSRRQRTEIYQNARYYAGDRRAIPGRSFGRATDEVPMAQLIRADDGDEVGVHAFQLSARQAVVRLEIDNRAYDGCDSDWITLSAVSARSLAQALLAIADDIERAGQASA